MKRHHLFWLLGLVFGSSLFIAACTDDSLMEPEQQPAPTSELTSSPAGPLSAALGTGQCMGDDAVNSGNTSGLSDPLALNCTANDVRIANAETKDGTPIQCVPGETLTGVDIVADIVETSTSVRHDIGIWIAAADNMGGGAESGSCDFFYFDKAQDAGSGTVDADGDQCLDMENAGVVNAFDLGNLTLTCPTNPVVQDGKTFIEVASCVSWTQPGGDRACPDTSAPTTAEGIRWGTVPANKSKCNCEPFLVEVEILAQLTLLKDVTNDHGGTAVDTDWTLQAASSDTTISGVEGDAEITNSAIPAGTFTLSESGGPSGYTAGSWSCTGDGTQNASQITLEPGDIATCTITNDDDPAQLTLLKKVVNDDGGTAVDTDWTLTATGPETITGSEGDASITNADVSAGTYTLSESGGPSGYAEGSWVCTGDGTFDSNNSTITLGLGESASCEITNDDAAAMLTLTKKVTNDDGGTAVDTDWTLTATGPETISGSEGDASITNAAVDAGTYTLSESGPANYTNEGWSCTGDGTFDSNNNTISLALGESAACEVTNNDDPATLTLLKKVVNDNGGTAVDTDWTLTATGPETITGSEGDASVTSASVDAGTYTLSESGPSGYTNQGWNCTGDGIQSGNQITLGLGESASCEVTNTDDPISLTLTKTVVNDDGGTAVDTDWTLTATGPITIQGSEGDASITSAAVNVGTYTLTESGPSGYSNLGWTCTGDGTQSGNQITLGLGDSATCDVKNDDDPATLTLTKRVINDDGGTAVDTDWTLTATGPETISGVEGDASITNASVDAGTYTLSESGGPIDYTEGSWVCTGDGTQSGNQITLGLGESASCEITNDDDPPECELGDRLVSVTLKLVEPSDPNTINIGVTDDNGPNPSVLNSSPAGPVGIGDSFTIVPDGGAMFFDSQNLRFYLNGVLSKDLKVHLSCSDDPAPGDLHSGSADGVSATLEKVTFDTKQFN